MPELTLYFDCKPTADADKLGAELKAGLERVRQIERAETEPAKSRFTGLEILAAVTLAAGIVHQSAGIVHDVRSIVEDLKALFKDISGSIASSEVNAIRVPVGLEPKPIAKLTEEDYQTLAEDLLSDSQA